MRNHIVLGLLGLIVLGLLAGFGLAWRPAIAAIDPPSPTSFPADAVARGRVLAGEGYCGVCHTASLAGGYPLKTSFGTIYATNITPDPETGIGRWSEPAFRRALHEGVARNGAHLFPAFPYDHFTKLTDADVGDLYAYLMTRPAVHAKAKRNTLPFPLNVRALQAGWKLLFFHPGRYQSDPVRSAERNRGAYLAEGLSHCGGCHTPRNVLGAEKTRQAYAGAELEGWIAPPLTTDNPSVLPWTREDIFSFLRFGASPLHGVAAGTMSPVVHQGLAAASDADLTAIAGYFADLNGSAAHLAGNDVVLAKAMASSRLGAGQEFDPDARLYVAACGSCHYNTGALPLPTRPELALSTNLRLSEPTNFIRVVIEGISLPDAIPNVMMPGFGHALSDADIVRLATYLRRTRANLPPWPDMDKKIAAIRKQERAR
ncbi:MAG: cytochrome c [Phenylobacterium sp.]